jgi:UDP-N-acetylglucosamine--N-acetylmuramyl-(pentapeptide) pyrophosphoryl-undecaprenol N-acetylglucosamine transferase
VIFVTVGTHQHPFERLVDALGALDPAELVVQYGSAAPPPGVARAEAFMPFEEMLEHYRGAEKVITHAGVGSILCSTREGHTPLVVPRRPDLGEHVDEHQAELTRALEARGVVRALWDTAELAAALAATPARAEASSGVASPLSPSVRDALRGLPAQAPSSA